MDHLEQISRTRRIEQLRPDGDLPGLSAGQPMNLSHWH